MAKIKAAKSSKFKPADPKFTGRGGGKHTTHDAAWIGDVVSAVKAGTPAELKGHAISYHGVAPHDGEIAPGPRPSVAPVEPCDVPGADDQTRHIDSTPYPTAHGHKSPGNSPKVPATCGAK